MIVSLITKERVSSVSLPEKASGKYWVTDSGADGRKRQVADIEGIQGNWYIHGSAILVILDDMGSPVKAMPLGQNSQIIKAQYRDNAQNVRFYIEQSSEDRRTFAKYCVLENCRLDIGRSEENQIVIANKYVSGHHACLIRKDGKWSITDTQSNNGTFVNGERIATRQLTPGDLVYIMGIKIIVGHDFFSLNNPGGTVKINTNDIVVFPKQEYTRKPSDYEEIIQEKAFYRSPSIHQISEKTVIKVDAPPQRQKEENTPVALLMGPALTMGMTAAVMGAVAIYNLTSGSSTLPQTLPTLIMSFAMLCGTVLWPALTRRHDKRVKDKTEQLRQQKYREYLDDVRNKLFSIKLAQKTAMLECFPSVTECEQRAISHNPRLWERSDTQEDFLKLRLGLGMIPVEAEIKFPEQRFSIEEDVLQNDLQRLAGEPKFIQDAPVLCSFKQHKVTGVVGTDISVKSFSQSLILQMVSLHSYDEVKLVFVVGSDNPAWNSFRMLPHVWDDRRQNRYWIVDEDDAKALLSTFERVFAEREESKNKSFTSIRPFYFFVVADLALAERMPIFKRILTCKDNLGFSCLVLGSAVAELPKECTAVIQINKTDGVLIDQINYSNAPITFQREDSAGIDVNSAVLSLANIVIQDQDKIDKLPNMLTFMELYGVGNVEHLNAFSRWFENNPVKSLQAPVGVARDGLPIYLDLHEKYHGPHGLIAGMTGSGKSEFIITYILSMALNYHPNEVAFILIDYKGGGLAGAFENSVSGIRLPHLAGTITNLDGTAVNRALISIQSELRRRQAIFNDARRISGEGTIDIYKYQKMYRSGQLKTPVPHLFIISDEFAELKSQQPEFMQQLISTARIGRSLGVHLILATQKPSGVVDDQIWSNSRFRVCLKVQERADSSEMLKRPDAAELSDTGRFYLQVGYNELFELGQSAWCGAAYVPTDRLEKKKDNSVELIDHIGQTIAEAKPIDNVSSVDYKSQIVEIVSYLSELANSEQIGVRQLWLPPIPEYIYSEELRKKYAYTHDIRILNPVIGEYDDPLNQSQNILTVPFSERGNALVYGATGSGKTTLINTLLCDLIRYYDAEHLNIYIIDLGEETLRCFESAPQVGDVLLSSDQEKITNLFKMLDEEIIMRKKLFADSENDYSSCCRNDGTVIPHVLVVLRNYSAFSEQFEELETTFARITRECTKYGVYFLATANSANAIRYRITQNFSAIYSLQLNDKSDYIGLFGNTGGIYPSKILGRGIFKTDRIYEFQTARIGKDFSVQAIRNLSDSLRTENRSVAPCVPHLPRKVTSKYFGDHSSSSKIPIGIEKHSLHPSYLNLEKRVMSLIMSQDTYGLSAAAQGVAEALLTLVGRTVVIDGCGLFENVDSKMFAYQYVNDDFSSAVEILFKELVYRNNSYKDAIKNNEIPPVYEPLYYLITGIQIIFEQLDSKCKDELQTLLEKAELQYGVRFIICDTAKAISGLISSSWYKKHISGADGIWVGDGISDQCILKIGRVTRNLYASLEPYFGYAVNKGKPTLVKLIAGETYEEEEN